MTLDELDPLAPISFSQHAGDRWTERFGGNLDKRVARGEIRSGLLDGRAALYCPAFARKGHRRLDSRSETGCAYVWDPDETRVWIVSRAASGNLYVRTMLAAAVATDDRLIRRGYVRR